MADVLAGKSALVSAKPPRSGTALLIWPAIAFLVVFFVLPIIWFIGKSALSYDGNFALMLAGAFMSPLFIAVAFKTVWISAIVTLFALLLAYPVAYALAQVRAFRFTLIIICVVIPYFTSIIVRTYSWMIILGNRGVLNTLLASIGVISKPVNLMYNQTGVVIGMTYVLLPYFVLTLFSTMKGIDMRLLQAAHGMGASRSYAFRKIFLPLSVPGVISGVLIVFILAMGFFVTPALMGGPKDVMMAMLIQRNIEVTMNWPQACALSIFLLVITLAIYAVYCRFTDLDRMLGK